MAVKLYHGDIVYTPSADALAVYENSYIAVDSGKVEGIYPVIPEKYKHAECIDYGRQMIIPAFSDLHVHGAQYVQRGIGMDCLLSDWLNNYTFPQESRFKDMDYAKKLGYRIKLIAQAKKLDKGYGIDVSPTLIGIKDIVANVNQAYNVVEITCNYLENVIFYGKGAGRYVTASAVVSDIMKTHRQDMWKHDYQYEDRIYPITYSKYYVRCDHPLDIDYETYFSQDKDHIYITNKIELDELLEQLQNETYNLFKVRG